MAYKDIDEKLRNRYQRIICGGLKDCIKVHGPITLAFLDSASRRVLSRLISEIEKDYSKKLDN